MGETDDERPHEDNAAEEQEERERERREPRTAGARARLPQATASACAAQSKPRVQSSRVGCSSTMLARCPSEQ